MYNIEKQLQTSWREQLPWSLHAKHRYLFTWRAALRDIRGLRRGHLGAEALRRALLRALHHLVRHEALEPVPCPLVRR